jgi:hypothetical protein
MKNGPKNQKKVTTFIFQCLACACETLQWGSNAVEHQFANAQRAKSAVKHFTYFGRDNKYGCKRFIVPILRAFMVYADKAQPLPVSIPMFLPPTIFATDGNTVTVTQLPRALDPVCTDAHAHEHAHAHTHMELRNSHTWGGGGGSLLAS